MDLTYEEQLFISLLCVLSGEKKLMKNICYIHFIEFYEMVFKKLMYPKSMINILINSLAIKLSYDVLTSSRNSY